MNAISSFIPDDPTFPPEKLLPYKLVDPDGAPLPPELLELETACADQLALDLALSSNVYSLRPFPPIPSEPNPQQPRDDEAAARLSEATQNMSINPVEPTPFKFGYLRPVKRRRRKDYTGTEMEGDEFDEEPFEVPAGVQRLLSE